MVQRLDSRSNLCISWSGHRARRRVLRVHSDCSLFLGLVSLCFNHALKEYTVLIYHVTVKSRRVWAIYLITLPRLFLKIFQLSLPLALRAVFRQDKIMARTGLSRRTKFSRLFFSNVVFHFIRGAQNFCVCSFEIVATNSKIVFLNLDVLAIREQYQNHVHLLGHSLPKQDMRPMAFAMTLGTTSVLEITESLRHRSVPLL